MSAILLVASIVASLSGASQQAGGVVEVRVTGTRPGGPLMVQMCTEAEFSRRCTFQTMVRITGQTTAVARFTGVPAGRYAVAAYQDVNSDNRLNFGGMRGAPTEPWGYSRAARGVMGPPRFSDAAVSVAATGGVIPVALVL